jgi:UDP-2,3-diacylglucosamine pyrophosphatase LpxH
LGVSSQKFAEKVKFQKLLVKIHNKLTKKPYIFTRRFDAGELKPLMVENNMTKKNILKRLNTLYKETPVKDISPGEKIVIFSDLHLGNGGRMDDFAHNSDFFLYVLKNYYYPGNYRLILNGDIEELHRFSLKGILSRWHELYQVLNQFHQGNSLFRVLGNHDYRLHARSHSLAKKDSGSHFHLNVPLLDALKLRWKGNDILIFHGHQAGRFNGYIHGVITFFMRYFANPLGIGSYSVAFNSKKKYKVEKRVYDFARERKILAMIGHTHRPLFESLSRIDTLKFRIETMCRKYPLSDFQEQKELEKKIKRFKEELQALISKETSEENIYIHTLYGEDPMVPCIFNSGCCIGRNGITALEIKNGEIRLVYWFDSTRTNKYFNLNGYKPNQLKTSDYYRVILKKESLDYVFSRVKLLS